MGAVGSEAVSCPLCRAQFDGMIALSAHLGGEHGLYDDEGAPASRLRPGPVTADGQVAPASWAPDPFEPGMLRYWDGEAWTTHTTPVPEPTPAPTSAAAGLVGRARSLLGRTSDATKPDAAKSVVEESWPPTAAPVVAAEAAIESPTTAADPTQVEPAARLRHLFPLVVVLIGAFFIVLAVFAR